jgi:hypothetical protein
MHELARRREVPARRVGWRWLVLLDRLAAAITPLDDPAALCPKTALETLERYATALLHDRHSDSGKRPQNAESRG